MKRIWLLICVCSFRIKSQIELNKFLKEKKHTHTHTQIDRISYDSKLVYKTRTRTNYSVNAVLSQCDHKICLHILRIKKSSFECLCVNSEHCERWSKLRSSQKSKMLCCRVCVRAFRPHMCRYRTADYHLAARTYTYEHEHYFTLFSDLFTQFIRCAQAALFCLFLILLLLLWFQLNLFCFVLLLLSVSVRFLTIFVVIFVRNVLFLIFFFLKWSNRSV